VYKVAQSIPTNVSDLNNDLHFIWADAVGNWKITINQWGSKKWEFTVNQKGNVTINLDAWWGWGWWWASVSDIPYWPSWNGVTNVAPSKNAVYDKIESLILSAGNVKLFTLTSNTDTTNSQLALDWLNAGKLPILEYTGSFGYQSTQWKYFFYPVVDSTSSSSLLIFECIASNNQYHIDTQSWYTVLYKPRVELTINWTTVTWITITDAKEAKQAFISPETDYDNLWNTFTPTRAWDPATKKYVDDRNWVWTQAQYDALVSGWQIVQWVIYNIISS
jgi:hypothetical protein